MRIGLVGEAPNDTTSIKNLLLKRFPAPDYEFIPMLDRIHGSQLDNQKTKRILRIEYEDRKPDVVIFIRDLDNIHTRSEQFYKKKQYFSSSNSVVNKQGVFLLNIYEIEALIIADIETFNRLYDLNIVIESDCMLIEEPKEFLKKHSKKYDESDNPEIFIELEFDTVHENCNYFKGFIRRFEKYISNCT